MLEKINPNHLTTMRLALTPVAAIFIWYQSFWSLIICIGVMVICELTDFGDGYIAKKYKKVTDLGKIYDPMCDSIYHLCIFLFLIPLGLPIWVMAIFVVRDIIVANARMYCMSKKYVLAARWTGKWKAGSQATFQFVIVIYSLSVLSGYSFVLSYIVPVFFVLVIPAGIVAVFFTLYSLFDYLYFVRREIYAKT